VVLGNNAMHTISQIQSLRSKGMDKKEEKEMDKKEEKEMDKKEELL